MSEKLYIPLSIIIAGALIGAGFYFNAKVSKTSSNTSVKNTSPVQQQIATSESIKKAIRPLDANDHVLGNPKARILIVEYSDTECPFCKNFHTTMLSIMKDYGQNGDVAWVYRHYPIAQIHSNSPKQAEALECAGELGGNSKFWEYTNKIYEVTTSNNTLDMKQLPIIAKQIGLDGDQFQTCLDSSQYAPRVNFDIQNAEELGASGTPYSVVIDTKTNEYYPIEGAYPYDQLKNVLEIILKS